MRVARSIRAREAFADAQAQVNSVSGDQPQASYQQATARLCVGKHLR